MPTHVLVIPRDHISSADTVEAGHGDVLADMVADRAAGGSPKGWPSGLPARVQRRRRRPELGRPSPPARARGPADGVATGVIPRGDRLPVPLRSTPVSPTQVKILVPGNHLMVELLGHATNCCASWRRRSATPRSSSGATRSRSAARKPTGWAACSRSCRATGPGPTPRRRHVGRTIEMVKADESPPRSSRPRSPAGAGPHGPTQDQRAEDVRRRHREERDHLRHRSRRHRQVVLGGRPGGAGVPGQARSAGSSSPAPRSRRASASASCPATCWPRSTPTCARSTTPSTTCSGPKAPSASSTATPSRSPPSPTCGAARSTTASSSSTRPRTPRPSR